ncbi:MAG: type II toxin-antitoxin system RelE/ParE family toxin [Terriglobales bacterium]
MSKPSRASNELPVSTTGWVLREDLGLRLKLDRLEAALTLSDLAVLPGNRFEALKGSRKGQYSIRVTRSGEC